MFTKMLRKLVKLQALVSGHCSGGDDSGGWGHCS